LSQYLSEVETGQNNYYSSVQNDTFRINNNILTTRPITSTNQRGLNIKYDNDVWGLQAGTNRLNVYGNVNGGGDNVIFNIIPSGSNISYGLRATGDSRLDGLGNIEIRAATGSQVRIGQTTNHDLVIDGDKIGINDLSPSYTIDMTAIDGIKLPVGTTAQRPTNVEGVLRYNGGLDELETSDGTNWKGLREQSHGFDTYTSDPGALTPRDGQVYGFDTTTAGWTQVFNTTNMSAGDQITIFFIATDVNTLTIDSGSGGFIRPVANGDFLSDLTEAIVAGDGHIDLVFDGTDWWVKE